MSRNLHHPAHHHSDPTLGMSSRRNFLTSLVSAAALVPWAFAQKEKQTSSEIAEDFRRLSEDLE
jgi:hypothetical protein